MSSRFSSFLASSRPAPLPSSSSTSPFPYSTVPVLPPSTSTTNNQHAFAQLSLSSGESVGSAGQVEQDGERRSSLESGAEDREVPLVESMTAGARGSDGEGQSIAASQAYQPIQYVQHNRGATYDLLQAFVAAPQDRAGQQPPQEQQSNDIDGEFAFSFDSPSLDLTPKTKAEEFSPVSPALDGSAYGQDLFSPAPANLFAPTGQQQQQQLGYFDAPSAERQQHPQHAYQQRFVPIPIQRAKYGPSPSVQPQSFASLSPPTASPPVAAGYPQVQPRNLSLSDGYEPPTSPYQAFAFSPSLEFGGGSTQQTFSAPATTSAFFPSSSSSAAAATTAERFNNLTAPSYPGSYGQHYTSNVVGGNGSGGGSEYFAAPMAPSYPRRHSYAYSTRQHHHTPYQTISGFSPRQSNNDSPPSSRTSMLASAFFLGGPPSTSASWSSALSSSATAAAGSSSPSAAPSSFADPPAPSATLLRFSASPPSPPFTPYQPPPPKAKKRRSSTSAFEESGDGSAERPISPITGKPTKVIAKRGWPPKDAAKRIYKCEVEGCGKSFGRPSARDTHMRSHNGTKPFTCPIPSCARPFSVFSNLKRHMIVHPTVDFRHVAVHDLPLIQWVPSSTGLPGDEGRLEWIDEGNANGAAAAPAEPEEEEDDMEELVC